ncbi:MAG TPA: glycosyltransferase family 1 protein [Gemmataceae bacterium]|nr:glycosyltransferase family 1 protein [Gemmataceae bacterium]
MRVILNQWAAVGRKTGIGHYVAELAASLPEQADGGEVVLFPPRGLQRVKEFLGLGYSYNPSAAACGLARLRAGLRGLLRRVGRKAFAWYFRRCCAHAKVDLYHEPNYIPLPCDVPAVVSLHDLSVLLHPEWHPRDRVAYFERYFADGLKRGRHFLTISEFIRQEVIRILSIPPERVTCVYPGIRSNLAPLGREQVDTTLRRLGLPPRYLLHVGTIEPRKNLLMLLRAYCALPAHLRERWPLLLAGGWGWNAQPIFDYWHAAARHRGVVQVGYVAEEDLPAVYNGGRALLCPSFYEGFGLPPVEMMACGGAVVASTAGALVETAGPRAHLLAPDDLDGWRDAMARVAEDEGWWRLLRRGVIEAARPFTWQRCAAETWAVYRAVHGGQGASRPLPRAA